MAVEDENKAQDEFDEAFGEAAEGREPDEDGADIGADDAGDDEPAGSNDALDDEGFEHEDGDGPGDSQDTGDTDEEEAETGGADDEIDYRAEFEAMQQRVRSWEGRLSAAARENAELRRQLEELKAQREQADQGAEDDTADEPPSDEQVSDAESALEEFYEDFPALREPLQLLLRQAKEEAVREATGKVKEVVDPIVTQQQQAQQEAERRAAEEHLAAISKAHPDWQDLASTGKLHEWAETLPYREATEAMRILSEGDTQEVIDLLSRYKESAGGRQGAGKRGSIQDRRARQAADAEAVRSRPGGPPRGAPDPDDFDGAFEEAAASIS